MKQKVYTDSLLEIIKDMGRARFHVDEGLKDTEKLPDFVIIEPGKPLLNEEPRKGSCHAKKAEAETKTKVLN